MSLADPVQVAIQLTRPFLELVFFLEDVDLEVAASDFFPDVLAADEDDGLPDEGYFFAPFAFEVDLEGPAVDADGLVWVGRGLQFLSV